MCSWVSRQGTRCTGECCTHSFQTVPCPPSPLLPQGDDGGVNKYLLSGDTVFAVLLTVEAKGGPWKPGFAAEGFAPTGAEGTLGWEAGNSVSLGPGPPHKHPEGPGPGLLDPGCPAGWTPCLCLPLGPPLTIWCRVCAHVSLFTGASAALLLGVGRVRKQVVSTHACYILGVHGAVGWDSVGGQCAHRNLAEECAKGRRVETACGGGGGGGGRLPEEGVS